MAAIEDGYNMSISLGDLSDQRAEFLVGEVPATLLTAIVTNEGLVEPVRLKMPELGGSVFLRTVAAIIE